MIAVLQWQFRQQRETITGCKSRIIIFKLRMLTTPITLKSQTPDNNLKNLVSCPAESFGIAGKDGFIHLFEKWLL